MLYNRFAVGRAAIDGSLSLSERAERRRDKQAALAGPFSGNIELFYGCFRALLAYLSAQSVVEVKRQRHDALRHVFARYRLDKLADELPGRRCTPRGRKCQ